MKLSALFSTKNVLRFALIAASLVVAQPASVSASSITQTPATQPPSGLAGTTYVYLTGSGFPLGPIVPSDVTVHFSNTCLGAPVAETTATLVKAIIRTTDRVTFVIPGSLETATYSVWVSSTTYGFTSVTCSALQVTGSTKKIASCIPSSSLALALGSTVTAYIPHGSWDYGTTGIGVVELEGPTPGPVTAITTAGTVNACSSNSITGQTVCTANDTDVYLITGTTLNTTLTSGANTTAGFSGGSCENCGVAINATNNTAYIEEGLTTGVYRSGVQALNLTSNTFAAPFPMQTEVSENIAIDPFLNFVLTPGEIDSYTILQIAPSGALAEFDNFIAGGGGDFDSAAEDCTTGIALASDEFATFPYNIYIQDLTQADFTSGSPAGSYTALGQFQTLDTTGINGFSAGTNGISVAPGSAHLAVTTGEFGGNTFAVLRLPSKSGSGTPALVGYASAEIPPNPAGGSSPCAGGFTAGYDPHTITAYTSPNNGKAYAVFAGFNGVSPPFDASPPNCLVTVDLQAVLDAPRGGASCGAGPNVVCPADFPAAAVQYFPIP